MQSCIIKLPAKLQTTCIQPMTNMLTANRSVENTANGAAKIGNVSCDTQAPPAFGKTMDHINPYGMCAAANFPIDFFFPPDFRHNFRLFFTSFTTTKFLMSHRFARRLLKEHKAFEQASLPGVEMLPESEITKYFVAMSVDNPLYTGQSFLLLITIGNDYPVGPPLVKFVVRENHVVPLHPHVYSNGHICLNVLGKDWTPACGVETIVLSVQSMLSTNELAERPPDDSRYVRVAPRDPKNGSFVYHDDSV